MIAVGAGVSDERLGERMLVRTMQQHPTKPFECITVGSEYEGGFAQYTCAVSDAELASIPCAYVIAVAGAAKHKDVKVFGADQLVARGEDLVAAIGADNVDLVAGPD